MITAQTPAPTNETLSEKEGAGKAASATHRVSDSLRKCIVTGDELQKDQMIRFVIAPDQSVVPDLQQNLPGRGLWVTATHDAITTATRKNLFAKAAREPAKPAADLADLTAQLTRARALNLLGLAKSAGITTLGQMQVESGVKSGKIKLLFIADDAGRDIDKLGGALKEVTVTRRFTRTDLGSTLGHERIVYAGLPGHQLTTKIRATLKLYDALSTPSPEPTLTETDV